MICSSGDTDVLDFVDSVTEAAVLEVASYCAVRSLVLLSHNKH
jgi:hypothetical protein